MDPDAVWAQMLKAHQSISDVLALPHTDIFKRGNLEELAAAAAELSSQAEDLQDWVKRGGFWPAEGGR